MADQELKIRIKGEYSEAGLKELESRLIEMRKQIIDLKSKFGTKSEWVKSEQKAIIDLQNDIKSYKTGLINQKRDESAEIRRIAKDEATEIKRLAKEKADAEKQAARDAKLSGQATALDSINAIKQQILYFSKLRNEVSRNSEEFKRYTDKVLALKREYNGLKTNTSSSLFKLMEFGENLTVVSAGIFSFAQRIFGTANELMKMGGNLTVLRSAMTGFTGSTEATKQAIDLFGTALAGNLSESKIMTLANRFLELGYSVEETAKFFDLAENISDKFGISIEESMQKLLRYAETGKGRGFEQMAIDINKVNERAYELAGGTEQLFRSLEAEEQQIIRTRAMLELYGDDIDSIKNKQQDLGDKIYSSAEAWENLKAKAGEVLLISMADNVDRVNGQLITMGNILESDIAKGIIQISNFVYDWGSIFGLPVTLVGEFQDKIEYLKIGIPIVAERYGLITIEATRANVEVEGTVNRIKDAIVNMRNLLQIANQASRGPDTTGWVNANQAWKGDKEKKSGYSGKGPGKNPELEEAKKEFEELEKIIEGIKNKKVYNEWDFNMLSIAMDELIVLQAKYTKGSEEHLKVQKEIDSLNDEALKMGDEAMKQYEAEKKEKDKIWQAELKRREEIKKQVADLQKESERLSIDLTENEIEKKKESVRYEYAEKFKNLDKLFLLEKNKNSDLYREIEKQKKILWEKERIELKKIQTELITGIITTFQSDLQGVQNIAGNINRLFNEGGESMLQKFITALEIVRQMKELIESIGDYKDILKGLIGFIPGASFVGGESGGGGFLTAGMPGSGGNGFGLDFIPVRGNETVREVPYVVGSKISGRDIDLLLRRVEKVDGGRIG